MYEELINRLRSHAELDREYNGSGKLFEDAADAIEELNKPRWISVTERLPEEDIAVLTRGEQACVLIDWLHNGKWVLQDGITHWMPLPGSPTECRQMVTDSNQPTEVLTNE